MVQYLKIKVVLLDVSGSLIAALNLIHSYGYDYREVHCTQRVDDQFDLIVDVEVREGNPTLKGLCEKLLSLENVLDIGQVGKRRNPQRIS